MKKVYCVILWGEEEKTNCFYKFFEYQEDAQKELKRIAKSYDKKYVKWESPDEMVAEKDHWSITAFPLY